MPPSDPKVLLSDPKQLRSRIRELLVRGRTLSHWIGKRSFRIRSSPSDPKIVFSDPKARPRIRKTPISDPNTSRAEPDNELPDTKTAHPGLKTPFSDPGGAGFPDPKTPFSDPEARRPGSERSFGSRSFQVHNFHFRTQRPDIGFDIAIS